MKLPIKEAREFIKEFKKEGADEVLSGIREKVERLNRQYGHWNYKKWNEFVNWLDKIR